MASKKRPTSKQVADLQSAKRRVQSYHYTEPYHLDPIDPAELPLRKPFNRVPWMNFIKDSFFKYVANPMRSLVTQKQGYETKRKNTERRVKAFQLSEKRHKNDWRTKEVKRK